MFGKGRRASGEQVRIALRFALWDSGRRKLCMVPCHSCYIYEIWRSKEVEGRFKVIIWGSNANHKVVQFLWERGFLIM